MVTRALIIAIENYPNATDVGTSLPGVTRDAERFRDWLVDELQVQADDVVICAGEEWAERTFDDSITGICKGVNRLIETGRDSTERLFVFVAGHGVTATDRGIDDDFLLTSDFVNARDSGSCCVPIACLADLLSRAMGPGEHIWFVDMCRTKNVTLVPVGLGLNPQDSTAGEASRFTLFSTGTGLTAANDSLFVDTILSEMNCEKELVENPDTPGVYQVRFQSVAEKVSRKLQAKGRETYHRAEGSKSDVSIRTIRKPGPTATILRNDGFKSPPVKLLTGFEELIFLGETLGQLSDLVEEALEFRDRRPWRSIELFAINDLSQAFRPDASLEELIAEREQMEAYFKRAAAEIADELRLYRYNYVGTYASLWRSDDGRRRVHASSGVLGIDIRQSAATDYVDFPEAPLSTIEWYYEIVDELKRNAERCSVTFHHARPVANG